MQRFRQNWLPVVNHIVRAQHQMVPAWLNSNGGKEPCAVYDVAGREHLRIVCVRDGRVHPKPIRYCVLHVDDEIGEELTQMAARAHEATSKWDGVAAPIGNGIDPEVLRISFASANALMGYGDGE